MIETSIQTKTQNFLAGKFVQKSQNQQNNYQMSTNLIESCATIILRTASVQIKTENSQKNGVQRNSRHRRN